MLAENKQDTNANPSHLLPTDKKKVTKVLPLYRAKSYYGPKRKFKCFLTNFLQNRDKKLYILSVVPQFSSRVDRLAPGVRDSLKSCDKSF